MPARILERDEVPRVCTHGDFIPGTGFLGATSNKGDGLHVINVLMHTHTRMHAHMEWAAFRMRTGGFRVFTT